MAKSKLSKFGVTIVVLIAIAVSVVGLKYVKELIKPDPHKGALARVKGSPKAKVEIVEFMDFECPACAAGSKILRTFMKDHPNIVRLDMRYFPLDMHKHSYLSARYAECAAREGKFWEMLDMLIDQQAQWTVLPDAKPTFDKIATELKLNPKKLEVCLQDDKVYQVILDARAQGRLLGVKSTPTYFINGQMIVGSKSLEIELNKLVDEKAK